MKRADVIVVYTLVFGKFSFITRMLLLSLINRYTSYNMCTCTWQTQAMATQRRWGRLLEAGPRRRARARPDGPRMRVPQLARCSRDQLRRRMGQHGVVLGRGRGGGCEVFRAPPTDLGPTARSAPAHFSPRTYVSSSRPCLRRAEQKSILPQVRELQDKR